MERWSDKATEERERKLMTWQTAITLLAPIIPVVVGYLLSRKKMEQIHLLVNSRLDEALHKIASLERALVVSKKKEA